MTVGELANRLIVDSVAFGIVLLYGEQPPDLLSQG